MTPQYVFDVWAPASGPWSDWAKPVLFAHIDPLAQSADVELAPQDTSWAPPADGATVLVLDLRGKLGIECALSLASAGYRPVPLYNAVPSSSGLITPPDPHALCDLTPIIAAMRAATSALDRLNLAYDAPPAFLLDADRRVGMGRLAQPGLFDNRSVSLPTDFPSANLLLSRGVRQALLIQEDATEPQPDLAHTLLRWQDAGIEIKSRSLALAQPPTTIIVHRPPLYRRAWQRTLAVLGFRRSPLGGFGGFIPIPSAG